MSTRDNAKGQKNRAEEKGRFGKPKAAKFREETPGMGGGFVDRPRYRAAAIWSNNIRLASLKIVEAGNFMLEYMHNLHDEGGTSMV